MILIFISWILLSCSSAPLSVNHYLLHSPTPPSTTIGDLQKSSVTFDQVIIADYLRQVSLVIQMDDHKLYFSRQDIWAESLQTSFYKALKYDLNLSKNTMYVTSHQSSEQEITLKVKLEHFHITNHSSVISSGTYMLLGNNTQGVEKPFYFTLPLKQDGYPHAVSQLRKTVKTLAQQINQDIGQWQSK